LDGANNPTIFRTNDLGKKHFRGLYYSASARVDRQPFKGNTWLYNNYPEYGARNDNPVSVLNDQYFVEQGGANNLPVPLPLNNNGWFQSGFNRDENCDLSSVHHGMCYSTQNPVPVPANFLELIRIARDSAQSIEYDEEARWKAKVELYEKLLQMPQYMDSSAELADFFQACAGTMIQKIANLHVETNNLQSNNGTLVEIMEANAMEIYQKSESIRQCEELLNSGNLNNWEKDSIIDLKNAIVENINHIVNYNANALHVLDSVLAIKVDLLNGENQSINSIEIIEQNEKIINEVYFSSLAKNQYESIFNYAATILNVAVQCPLSGGPAVYRARALYYVIDPNMYYEDELTCLQNGYLYRTSRNISQKSKLYPNPTANEITVVYNATDNSEFQICDQIGRIVYKSTLSSHQTNYTLSVLNFENGIYNYRILDKNKTVIDIGQFIVSK
jgi:hypothetical protein